MKVQQVSKKFKHQKIGTPIAPCETKHVHFGDIVDFNIERTDKKSSKHTEIKFSRQKFNFRMTLDNFRIINLIFERRI